MRTVVVTGGKRGIGAAISAALRGGDQVIALGSADMDVTDEAAVARVLGELEVDVLVNNAGVSSSAPVHKTTLDEWERQIARERHRRVPVHARGAARDARARPRPDRHRRVARRAVTARATRRGYTASKHAVLGFMRALAAELAGTGVTANCVCPAYVRSDMTDTHDREHRGPHGQGRRGGAGAMAPLGRLIEPEEVAFAVAFFAAPEAGAINGQTLIMTGEGSSSEREFGWEVRDGVGFVTLVGAERKNPLTFASYAALRDHFRELAYDDAVDAVVIAGEAGNFCSRRRRARHHRAADRDGHAGLLRFTRMTGDLVKAIRAAGSR